MYARLLQFDFIKFITYLWCYLGNSRNGSFIILGLSSSDNKARTSCKFPNYHARKEFKLSLMHHQLWDVQFKKNFGMSKGRIIGKTPLLTTFIDYWGKPQVALTTTRTQGYTKLNLVIVVSNTRVVSYNTSLCLTTLSIQKTIFSSF
jgi:hypothetical protein